MINIFIARFISVVTKLGCLILLVLLIAACESDVSDKVTKIVSKAENVANNSSTAPSFRIGQTRISGVISADGLVDSYLGVPFAEPPVGGLRWAPPSEHKALTNSLTATEFADACMQGPHLTNWYKDVILSFGGDPKSFPGSKVSEDCLYLNIWRPHYSAQRFNSKEVVVSAPEPLPVFVFIHGGSNKGGWSYEPNYLGEEMAKRGVIVVSIAYRLGAFGFFSHPELEHSNFGLLDQVAALQWIQSNIAALGGDPNRVTVAGESAGANNIEYLISMPEAKGLFQRAIHQSGGSPMLDRNSKKAAQDLGEKLFATVLEDTVLEEKAKGNPLEAMRSVSAQALQTVAEEVYQGHYFDVVVDQKSILQTVSDAAGKLELAPVDLMIGTNANENLMYLDTNQSLTDWLRVNAPHVSLADVQAALDSGSSKSSENALEQLDRVSSGLGFTCPSLKFAKGVAEAGGHSWVYYFSKVREGSLAQKMGAYHGAELPYMFNTHDAWLPTDEADRELTETMLSYWIQFIRTGDPNSDAVPTWPEYSRSGDLVQVLDRVVESSKHSSQKLCEILLLE